MAHTQAINEATPAGTDSASGGAAQFRDLKRDIRQRMELQHYWNDALTGDQEDGKHINITIGGTGVTANTALIAASGGSLTGSNATAFIDVAGTWNTTGTPTAIKVNVTDTASNAASKLLDLQVGGVSKVSVDKAGIITGNGSGLTTLNLGLASNTGTIQTARLGSGTANTTTYLRGDSSWQTVTTVAGSNTQVQFNNSGSLGASSNLTWNGSTLAVTGSITATAGVTGVIKSIQRGTISISGTAASGTATITAVTMAKAVVLFKGSKAAISGQGHYIEPWMIELTNTTTVTVERTTSAYSGDSEIPYEVLEFN